MINEITASMFYSDEMRKLFSARSTIASMLSFEAALARALSETGIIPAEHAAVIEKFCDVERIDMALLEAEAPVCGNAVIPLVRQLTFLVRQADPLAAGYVHFGITSQDVIDTALALQCKAAFDYLESQISSLGEVLAAMAGKHRHDIMVGRTLLQHARPVSFGYKAAGWLQALMQARVSLKQARKAALQVSFGGAVGNLSAYGDKAPQVMKALEKITDLPIPVIPLHTHRQGWVQVASVLSMLSGGLGKMAKDIILLMQTEVAEVSEIHQQGAGGSSAMPHKNNPVKSTLILAIAHRTPSLASMMLSAMPQEHERAAGAWQAEWDVVPRLFGLSSAALEYATQLLATLKVDRDRMTHNLQQTKGQIFAENIALALAPKKGRVKSHKLVKQWCKEAADKGVHLKDYLIRHTTISQLFSTEALDALFDPLQSLGMSDAFINKTLNEYQRLKSKNDPEPNEG